MAQIIAGFAWVGFFTSGMAEESQLPPIEEVRPNDASWCGPRVLFFFGTYFGKETSLEEIIALCKTDERGFTSLFEIIKVAKQLDLEPDPIFCKGSQFSDLEGPAILCLKSDFMSSTGETLYHFIGLIKKQGERVLIFDPSRSLTPFEIEGNELATRFSGKVVLLKGCPFRGQLRDKFLEIVWIEVLLFGFLVCWALKRRIPKKTSFLE